MAPGESSSAIGLASKKSVVASTMGPLCRDRDSHRRLKAEYGEGRLDSGEDGCIPHESLSVLGDNFQ